jgi:23S rRNA (pseudouridine1915-N3)-methyltransferase
LKLLLAAVGRLKAGPERELFDRYAARAAALAPRVGLSGLNFREFDESRARTAEARRAEEGRALLDAAGRDAFVCALDERGAAKSSAAWAEEIARARDAGQPAYAIVIGGPDGLDPEIRRAARSVVAFGALTWPHQLARVMAAEQIYRCFTILAGHPYHRA